MVLPLGFIGAGKVGCSLGRHLMRHGMVRWVDFLSRDAVRAQEAAEFCGGAAYASVPDLVRDEQLIFITVPDSAITQVAGEVADACRAAGVTLDSKIFAHCSGALGADALAPLREAGALVASCHPLYAVSSRFDCWQELRQAWFTLEGDDEALQILEALLAECGNRCVRIPADQKTRYHAAAVMASNLVVGLYETAVRELVTCGFSATDAEAALAPLFLGNARHIAADGVAASLTGPAARGDAATIEAHLSCLSGDTKQIYRLLTDVLYSIAGQSS